MTAIISWFDRYRGFDPNAGDANVAVVDGDAGIDSVTVGAGQGVEDVLNPRVRRGVDFTVTSNAGTPRTWGFRAYGFTSAWTNLSSPGDDSGLGVATVALLDVRGLIAGIADGMTTITAHFLNNSGSRVGTSVSISSSNWREYVTYLRHGSGTNLFFDFTDQDTTNSWGIEIEMDIGASEVHTVHIGRLCMFQNAIVLPNCLDVPYTLTREDLSVRQFTPGGVAAVLERPIRRRFTGSASLIEKANVWEESQQPLPPYETWAELLSRGISRELAIQFRSDNTAADGISQREGFVGYFDSSPSLVAQGGGRYQSEFTVVESL